MARDGDPLKFDIFCEIQEPAPFRPDHEAQVLRETIEQAREADRSGFDCWWNVEHHGAPGFSLGALSWDYGSHTWHTHRDTYDKLVLDDLKNNAVLTASLTYLAADDPEFVDRTRRSVITGRNGQPGQWPTCSPATRRSSDSPRMQ